MFDTHCHFNLEEFEDDIDAVIAASRESGVQKFLVPGIDTKTSKRSLELRSKHTGIVYSAVGIHPNYSLSEKYVVIERLLSENVQNVTAIGEIGLDFFRTYAPREIQKEMLRKMLSLAAKHQLPICLHNRKADAELVQILSKWYPSQNFNTYPTGVFHAFDGSEEIAEWGLTHGFYFGIGGLITYKKSDKFQNTLRKINPDSIILETDSPFLAPTPYRGKRNVPSNLQWILEELSHVLDIDIDTLKEVTTRNANKLFGLNKKMPPGAL